MFSCCPDQVSSRTHKRLVIGKAAKRSRLQLLICLVLLVSYGFAQAPATDKPDVSLPPFSVQGIHVTPNLPSGRMKLEMQLSLNLGSGWPEPNGDFFSTPSRGPQAVHAVAFSAESRSAWIKAFCAASRDETVRPRGLPALVLRDGLLIANPFDGSVPWLELPQDGLQRVEGVPAGGGIAWGAGTAGGALQLFTQEPLGKIVTEPGNARGQALDGGPPIRHVLATGSVNALLGGLGTRSTELITSQPTTRGILQILGGAHTTDGAPVLSEEQRGAVDEAAWNRGRWLETRWRQPVGKDTELLASVRTFENSRGAGTPGQFQEMEGGAFSLTMAGSRAGDWAWNGSIYGQVDDARGALSSIAPARAVEMPAIRLIGLPASRFGASWAMYWWNSDNARMIVGTDVRRARGESREEFAFANDYFTRERFAGGTQDMLGVFALHERALGSALRTTFGVRVETWEEHSGRFRDKDRISGTILQEKSFRDTTGLGLIPSAGVTWSLNRTWRLKADTQSSFRLPTLAELYQTWGEPGTVTTANPNLNPEKNTSFEVTLEYAATPKPNRSFSVTAFYNRLRDVIDSRSAITIFNDFPGIGLLPVGLSSRQRINLDRAEVQGLVFSGYWQLGASLTVTGRLEINGSTILKAPGAEIMVGKCLPYLGNRVGSLTARWQPPGKFMGSVTARSLGRRFADEENVLRLSDAVMLDATLAYQLTPRTTFSLRVENATNEHAESSRDAQGIVYLGTPRVLSGAIRFAW